MHRISVVQFIPIPVRFHTRIWCSALNRWKTHSDAKSPNFDFQLEPEVLFIFAFAFWAARREMLLNALDGKLNSHAVHID